MKEKSIDRLNTRRLEDEDLERLVFDAFQEAGWIVPKMEEDVTRAEEHQASSGIRAPECLSDPYEVFEEMRKRARYREPLLKKMARA